MIQEYSLSLKEIGTLKRGDDVVRENGTVLASRSFTYRRFKPRSFAYCSDTAPFKDLVSYVRGVDLLYHEATFGKDLKKVKLSEKKFLKADLKNF